MLTNDRDIISSVIIELTKHFTSLLASYKENNNLIQDNDIIDVKYDEKFDVFRVDLTKINYEYKNCIRNLFSKNHNKRDIKQLFSSNLKLYKMKDYNAVILSESNNSITFDMVKNANQFVICNFKKVLKEIKNTLPNNDEFNCYADVVNNNSIDICVQWRHQLAFSIKISSTEMKIECFESGNNPDISGMTVHYPSSCYGSSHDIIKYFMKFIKIYFEELYKLKVFIF